MPDAAAAPVNESEAYEALAQIAGRRTLPIPAELLVRHALALPGNWDWPVRRAALEAILRRLASIRTQEIRVVEAPRSGPWGTYVLARADVEGTLPYEVRLSSVRPIRGSCDCADFLRGSLALCKHLCAVLTHLASGARAFRRVLETPPQVGPPLSIVWDAAVASPVRIDPLEALGLSIPRAKGRAASRVPAVVARLFQAADGDVWRLRNTYASEPTGRLGLVKMLEQHVRRSRTPADPAARAVLAEERARLTRVQHLRSAAAEIRQAMGRVKRRLYPYQKEGVARFLGEGRLVLADDMGLGKTTQAIVAASALYQARLVRRGLLVVPASLKPQWEREWQAVSDVPLRVVDGSARDRRGMYETTRRGFLVTNYEQVVRDLDAVADWAPELVVLDEAQRIKNWATKTALTIKRLKPEYRLVLTGTPMENRLEELASIVEWVDDRALEPKWRLAPWHSILADGKREVIGARNLDSLRARLTPVLLRRVRAEVLAQLPARQDTVIPVDLTEEQREAHDELNQPIAKLACIARRRPLTPPEFLQLMSMLTNQRMIADGMALHNFEATWPAIRGRVPTIELLASLASPKLAELRELVANLALTQKRKIVVFSQWRRMLELGAWTVSDLLAAEGLRALFFTGQEGARRRTQNLVDFHDDPRAAVLFLTDAGGVGLNLQKAASACINLELPWNPAVLEQRIGRIHRLGQKRPIDVYNLASRACIEERIAALVSDKRALFKGLFDGSTDQLRFDRQSALLGVFERIAEPVAAGVPITAEDAAEDRPDLDPLKPEAGDDAAAGLPGLAAAPLPVTPDAGSPRAIALAEAGSDAEVARLFEAVRVERSADGGIRIEAPPEAARALMSLFDGMARLMAAAAVPAPPRSAANGAEAPVSAA